jgi:hypothetical protein
VKARGVLDIADDVHVHIVRARGTVIDPFGFPGEVEHLSGTISTVPHEGVELRARTRYGQERANVLVRYAEPSARVRSDGLLAIDVKAHALTAGTLQALGYDFVPDLATELSGTFALRGPVDDMTFAGSIDTPAGHADLQGRVQPDVGSQVTIYTRDGLRLDQVWAGAPEVTTRGLLRVDAPNDALTSRIHLELEPLVYDRFAIPGFELDGTLGDEGVRIEALRARSKTASLEGGGTISKDGALDVRVRARFRNIGDDENLRRLVPNARGGLEADVSVRTAGLASDFLHAQGRVTLTGFVYEDIAAENLVLKGFVRGQASRPKANLVVEGRGLRVGTYVLGDPKIQLAGGPRVYTASGTFVAGGRRTFDVDATVTAEKNGLLIEAPAIEVAVGQGTWRGALAGLRLRNDGVIELGQLRLASKSQRLEAKGLIRMQGPDELDAQLQDFDLAVVGALIGEELALSSGRADATVVLRGDLRDPVLDVQGALRGGSLYGIQDVNALFLVRYAHGAVEADGEVDLGGQGVVQLRGSGNIDPGLPDPVEALRLGRYDLELVSEDLDLTLVPQVRAQGVQGRLGGTLRWKGSIEAPEAAGKLTVRELSLPGMSAIDVSLSGSYLGERLAVDVALSDDQGPLLTAGGGLTLDAAALRKGPDAALRRLAQGPWQFRGQTTGRRLDSMPLPLRDALPYPAQLTTTFDLARDASGAHGSFELDTRWQTDLDSACSASARPRLRAAGTVANGKTALKIDTLVGPWRVGTFDAELRTDIEGWLDRRAFVAPSLVRASGRIEVQTLKRMPFLCEYGGGDLTADLTLDCTSGREPTMSVDIRGKLEPSNEANPAGAAQAALRSCAKDPVHFAFDFDAAGAFANGKGSMSGCGGGPTEMSAKLPIEWKSLLLLPSIDGSRDADVRLHFDEAQLKPLLERIPGFTQAEALAHGELRVQGKLDDPALSGTLDVHDGKVFLVSTGQTLTDLTAALELRRNWVKVERLSAHDGRGLVEVAGGIGLDGLAPSRARLAMRMDRLPIKQEGVDLGSLTGAGAVDAVFGENGVRGAITLHTLVIRLPNTSNRTLQSLDAHPDVVLTTAPPEEAPSEYTVELTIDGQRGLSVRRNDFEAQIATELSLRYRDPELRASGYVQFLGGEFEVFGKRFEVNNGSLRFDAEREQLDPQVFLLATQKAEAGLSPVTVTVTGTLSKPEVAFASDVCPGETGAITYLIAGQCVADDPDLAQDASNAQDAFATGMLSGVLTLGAQKELSAVMPRLAYSSTESGGSSAKLGISSAEIVPKFMRSVVRRVYVQGGYTTPGEAAATSEGTESAEDSAPSPSLDFLLELYFRHDIVGAGRFGEQGWGLDVTWEP